MTHDIQSQKGVTDVSYFKSKTGIICVLCCILCCIHSQFCHMSIYHFNFNLTQAGSCTDMRPGAQIDVKKTKETKKRLYVYPLTHSQAHSLTSDRLCANTFSLAATDLGLKNDVSNVLFPICPPELFSRMLQLCFNAKLQKYFVGYKNSPDFSSAWG